MLKRATLNEIRAIGFIRLIRNWEKKLGLSENDKSNRSYRTNTKLGERRCGFAKAKPHQYVGGK